VKLTLHGYWRSSATWRVRIALGLKGLAYAYVPVHLVKDGGEQHSTSYRAKNPMRQVPLLVVEDGLTWELTQSLAILEWLEEAAPEPAILPRDLRLRARVRQLAEIVNSGIQPLHNLSTLNALKSLGGDEKAFAKSAIDKGLDAYEAARRDVGGRFSVGDSPTIADACLMPQLYAARRFGADLDARKALLDIERACMNLEAFQAAHADRQVDAQPSP